MSRIKCIGGPLNKQFCPDRGDAFKFTNAQGLTFEYEMEAVRGVYVCKTEQAPEWDFDFYSVTSPCETMVMFVAEAPILRIWEQDVRYITYEWFAFVDEIKAMDVDPRIVFMRKAMHELIPEMEETRNIPRVWQPGEKEKARKSREKRDFPTQPPEDEKGNDTETV